MTYLDDLTAIYHLLAHTDPVGSVEKMKLQLHLEALRRELWSHGVLIDELTSGETSSTFLRTTNG